MTTRGGQNQAFLSQLRSNRRNAQRAGELEQENISLRFQVEGQEEVINALNNINTKTRTLGQNLLGLINPLAGGSLLGLFFAGSLGRVAISGGTASNAISSLQSSIEALLEPVGIVIQRFSDWFSEQNNIVQGLFLGAGAAGLFHKQLLALARHPIVIVLAAIAAGFYLIWSRVGLVRLGLEGLARFIADQLDYVLEGFIGTLNLLISAIEGIGNILSGGFANIQLPRIPEFQINRPDVDIYGNPLSRQPGQGFFQLTQGEREILNFFTGDQSSGGGNQNFYNFYGVNPGTARDIAVDVANNPNIQSRLQGGP